MLVVHCKKDSYDVLIDRSTPYGNPFIIGVDGDRDEVCKKYKDLLESSPELQELVMKLEGKLLGCWCKPKKCHGDIIVEFINKNKMKELFS